jgi:hypothetical protein
MNQEWIKVKLNKVFDQAKIGIVPDNRYLKKNIELLNQNENCWQAFDNSKLWRHRTGKELLHGVLKLGLLPFGVCATAVSFSILATKVGKKKEARVDLFAVLEGLAAENEQEVSLAFKTFLEQKVKDPLPQEARDLLSEKDRSDEKTGSAGDGGRDGRPDAHPEQSGHTGEDVLQRLS